LVLLPQSGKIGLEGHGHAVHPTCIHSDRRGALGAALCNVDVPGGPCAAAERTPQAYFGLHPDIESNPKAVFIRRTNVPDKMAANAKRKAALALAREIFVQMDHPAFDRPSRGAQTERHGLEADTARPKTYGAWDRSSVLRRPRAGTQGTGAEQIQFRRIDRVPKLERARF